MPNQKQNTPVFNVGKTEARRESNRALPFHTTYDGNGNITGITASGSVTGDAFPDAEVFVRDSQGNGVMLGTFSNASDASPFTSLPGNNARPMITIPETTINVENGVFTGVTYQGNRYSIGEWNQRMGVGQTP